MLITGNSNRFFNLCHTFTAELVDNVITVADF